MTLYPPCRRLRVFSLRSYIIKGIHLLGSGLLASIGFVLFAQGDLFLVDQVAVNKFLSFVAAQMLVVTIAKAGVDQQIFARFLGHEGRLRFGRRFFSLLLLVACLSFFYYSRTNCLVLASSLSVSVLLDVPSISYQSRLNGMLYTNKLLISNLLNYPFFFIFIYIIQFKIELTLSLLCQIFVFCSLLRFVFLFYDHLKDDSSNIVEVKQNYKVGIYQGLNYWLFRSAQLLPNVLGFQVSEFSLGHLFFQWKFVEMIDKGNLALSPLLYKMSIKPEDNNWIYVSITVVLTNVAFFVLGVSILGTFDVQVDLIYLMFIVNVVCLFPVNFLVFCAYRAQIYKELMWTGAVSVLVSLGMAKVVAFLLGSEMGLVSIVPFGLLCLAIIGYSRGWQKLSL